MNRSITSAFAFAISALGSISLALAPVVPAHATVPAWLDRLNQWRAAAGVSPLTENTTWDQGDSDHSLYMVKNDVVTHYEDPSLPYYTVDGDTAARNGNIEVNSSTSFTDTQAIDWWMAAPFHELGMVDPRLASTGFGSYREVKSGWQAGFTLDTLRGNSFTGGTYPVFFPGDGSSVPLTTFNGGEFPDPLQACPGYSAPTGLPVTIQIGGYVATAVGAHAFVGNGTPLAHCVIDSSNPSVGSDLQSRGAVILIPQQPLQPGVIYGVSLTVNGVPYTWTFSISTSGSILAGAPNATELGGISLSEPAASSWGQTRSDVFVRGNDNALWQKSWNGSTWGAWTSLGGILTAGPGAVSAGASQIDVFVRGNDNALWHRSWNGTAWAGWQSLGGELLAGPTVASWGSGRLDVFVVGVDSQLWHRAWNGTSWLAWEPLGGILTSKVEAVSWAANRIDVVGRGLDNALWHIAWNGTQWSSWQSLGGGFTSGPAIASCASGHLDVYGLGLDRGLWHEGWNGSAWSGWQPLAGYTNTDPAAVCPSSTTTVELFERSSDLSVIQSTAKGS